MDKKRNWFGLSTEKDGPYAYLMVASSGGFSNWSYLLTLLANQIWSKRKSANQIASSKHHFWKRTSAWMSTFIYGYNVTCSLLTGLNFGPENNNGWKCILATWKASLGLEFETASIHQTLQLTCRYLSTILTSCKCNILRWASTWC